MSFIVIKQCQLNSNKNFSNP